MNSRYAAIDFGTNTARLLIGERDDSGFRTTVLVEREIVRMGGGFSEEYGLSAEARSRGIACLQRFAGIMREHGVTTVRAVATSAVRDAVNREEFIAAVLESTGIQLSVVDGDQEGILTLRGVLSGLDDTAQQVMVLDVGGGSTEITIASCGTPVFVESLPIGVVRVTEGFGSAERMRRRVCTVIEELAGRMRMKQIDVSQGTTLVGTAGSATTLAAISMRMAEYDYRRVNNFVIRKAEIEDILERLLGLEPVERLAIAGLEKGREDLIIAGILIILQVMESFGFSCLKVSDYGLLEGLALSDDFCGTLAVS